MTNVLSTAVTGHGEDFRLYQTLEEEKSPPRQTCAQTKPSNPTLFSSSLTFTSFLRDLSAAFLTEKATNSPSEAYVASVYSKIT